MWAVAMTNTNYQHLKISWNLFSILGWGVKYNKSIAEVLLKKKKKIRMNFYC